jgi:DUF3006 family protein
MEIWVVDRVLDKVAVLVHEDGDIVVEVGVQALGSLAVEGAMLRVPTGDVGEPVWADATRDEKAEEARRAAAETLIEKLQERDPGGDIEL